MRAVIWISVFAAAFPSFADAQEKASDSPPPKAGFFGQKVRVSFWKKDSAAAPHSSIPGQVESLWAEPIRLPDGRMTTYVPPRQVLAFLENPSEESGLAYIAWQKERMAKIARASEILTRLSDKLKAEAAGSEKKPMTPGDPGSLPELPPGVKAGGELSPKAVPADAGEEILYFKREGCPHCRHEDGELAALKAERPGLKIKTLTPGEEDHVWKAFGVEVVPTIIVTRADGRKTVARGFTPKASLLAALTPHQGDKR